MATLPVRSNRLLMSPPCLTAYRIELTRKELLIQAASASRPTRSMNRPPCGGHGPRPLVRRPCPRGRPLGNALGEEGARQAPLSAALGGGDQRQVDDVALGVAAADADGVVADRQHEARSPWRSRRRRTRARPRSAAGRRPPSPANCRRRPRAQSRRASGAARERRRVAASATRRRRRCRSLKASTWSSTCARHALRDRGPAIANVDAFEFEPPQQRGGVDAVERHVVSELRRDEAVVVGEHLVEASLFDQIEREMPAVVAGHEMRVAPVGARVAFRNAIALLLAVGRLRTHAPAHARPRRRWDCARARRGRHLPRGRARPSPRGRRRTRR